MDCWPIRGIPPDIPYLWSMKLTHLVAILFCLPFLGACSGSRDDGGRGKKPHNIIFLIGDGMGLSQVSSAYYYGDGEPNFSRFRDIGLMKTSSSSHKITDSAAGATAFAAGFKSYNGAISVSPDTLPIPTIVEDLSAKGWNTGVISTSSITHATPACFYAHVKSRNLQDDIAAQLVESEVDFFAGGGIKFFAGRKDGQNLFSQLEEKGFVMDSTDISQPITNLEQKYGYLMAPNGMPQKNQDRDDFLMQATGRALEYLGGQKENFFLMIESSQIDWGGHDNDSEYLIAETLEFDEVIGRCLDFAEAQGNTLVVVTADHETGGFTLSSERKTNPDTGKEYSDYNSIAPTFSTGGHSTTLIPVFAWGRGSQKFTGVYENTHIHTLFKALSGL